MKTARLCITVSAFLLFSSACVIDDGGDLGSTDDVGVTDQALSATPQRGITWNGITWNGITWNGLTTYPSWTQYLLANSLSSDTYSVSTASQATVLRLLVADPDTRVFMKYLVSCALDEGSKVVWKNPRNSSTETYTGGMGFCPQWEGGSVADDTDCQEKVSACLLSRLNAFGVHVMLSERGMDAYENPLIPAVPMRANGKPIASQNWCGWWPRYGDSDCGWDAGWVGTCTPGSTVGVKISCSGNDLVRVCDRPYGCDQGDGHRLTTRYSACGQKITFTCPARGAYGLIGRPYYSTDPYSGFTATASSGIMPASEQQVFHYREGAAYGNIFLPDELGVYTWTYVDGQGVTTKWYYTPQTGWTQSRPAGPYVAHKNAYMCSSPEWDTDTAFRLMRICMGPSGDECAGNWAGNCASAKKYPKQEFVTDSAGLCAYEDSPEYLGDRDFDKCKGGGRVWQNPVSVWLQNWCDASPDKQHTPQICLNKDYQW